MVMMLSCVQGCIAPSVHCGICLQDIPRPEAHVIGGCRHKFCKPCLLAHLKHALKLKQLPAMCPHPTCRKQMPIKDCSTLMKTTPTLLQQLIEITKEKSAIASGTHIYCPNTNCSQLVELPKPPRPKRAAVTKAAAASRTPLSPYQARLKERQEKMATCQSCMKPCCIGCKAPWHAGLTCAEYQKLPVQHKTPEDMAVFQLSENMQWKRCPNCKFMIERIMGCNYMVCKCGCGFCYNCGQDYQTCNATRCVLGPLPGTTPTPFNLHH
eukprot:jgi/Chrzof1/2934/Cz12g05010.t1